MPRPEYPRPQFRRQDWTNLNGEWRFAFDDPDAGLANGWQRVAPEDLRSGASPFDCRITVPFCYQSKLSGIGETALLATRHLLRLGHRCIATVAGTGDRQVTSMRLKRYERALEEADVPYDPALVESGDWKADEAYTATLRLLDRAPDITAVYAQNDLMALGVMSALYARGLSVPEDFAVVGCDDTPMAKHTIPPLTTVHVPFYETGETAVRLLLDIIAGRTDRPRRVLLPVRLVRRGSCGAQAGATSEPTSGEE